MHSEDNEVDPGGGLGAKLWDPLNCGAILTLSCMRHFPLVNVDEFWYLYLIMAQ